jgi:hypothetical protein
MTDNSRTYTSVIDTEVYDNGRDYLDVNIYVTCPDGSEWRRTVSINKERQGLLCCKQRRVDCDDSFDEAAKVPPYIVRMMFEERWEEALALLKAEYARETSVKDHAEEMLKTLKSAVWMLERDFIDPQKLTVIEKCHATINKAEGRK